jgi:diacylglycerol kinase (ATP)
VSKQRIVFIINPNSGTDHKKKSLLNKLETFRKDNRFEITIEYTSGRGHAAKLTYAYLQKNILHFVAVGGDGTVNEVASQLIDTEAVLYIIPKGSGNGLARHLALPMDEASAIQRIISGKTQRIDCGYINNIPFLCTAGIGFDAYNADLFANTGKRGFLTYIQIGLSSYFNYKPVQVRFQNKQLEAFSLTFANANQFGNNAFIAPGAIINDGLLDCTLIKPHPLSASLNLARRLFNKTIIQSEYASTYQGKSFIIETNFPPLIHFDGEPYRLNENRIEVKVKENALTIGI